MMRGFTCIIFYFCERELSARVIQDASSKQVREARGPSSNPGQTVGKREGGPAGRPSSPPGLPVPGVADLLPCPLWPRAALQASPGL